MREHIWPRSLGTERLYTGTLRALDAVSAWSIPALQSGSLRSYALVLVLTAGVLITCALVWYEAAPLAAASGVRPSEAAIALLTMSGAISAVRARSDHQRRPVAWRYRVRCRAHFFVLRCAGSRDDAVLRRDV